MFSAQLNTTAPESRMIDSDAPAGLRLEFLDSVFSLIDTDPEKRVTDWQLYKVLKQSMGLSMAPDNPMAGPRGGAGAPRQIKDLPWPRVYDLICRWWSEFPEDMRPEYQRRVNILLSAYRIAWDLSEDGQLHRVLPVAVQDQVDAAFKELSQPRFAAALTLFRDAMTAYDDRPQRGREACASIFDALESVAKEVFSMPTATFGNVLAEASKQQSMESGTISAQQKLYDIANAHFRHGMTTTFTLKPAEVDFVLVSCFAGILLFVRL
jgi:hypothetical protein